MTTPAGILSDFASILLLFRDHPDKKEEQKQAFRRLTANLPDGDHQLRVTQAGFRWDHIEIPVGRGEVAALHDQFRQHGVGEVRIPSGLMSSTLLSLVRILAAPPGTYGSFDHLSARLDAAGCGVIPVLPLEDALKPAARAAPTVDPRPAAKGDKVDDEGHITAIGPDALTEAKVGMMHFVTMQTHTVSPTDELVDQISHAPSSAARHELLNQLIATGEFAARQKEWRQLLMAAHGLVELERKDQGHLPGWCASQSVLLPDL